MISILYLVMAFILYLTISRLNKDYYHPSAMLVFFWFLSSSLASYEPLYNQELQKTLTVETHSSIIIAGLCLFFPAFILSFRSHSPCQIQIKKFNSNVYNKRFLDLFIIFSVLAFFVRFNSIILNPPIFSMELSDLKEVVPKGIPFVHYFDLLTPFLAIAAIHEILFSNKIGKLRHWYLIGFILCSLLTAVIYKVSRGELLITMLGGGYLFYFRYRFSFFKLFIIALFLIIVFLCFTYFRLSEGSAVSNYLGDGFMAHISPVYTYVAIGFENFNKLTLARELDYTYFIYSLKFIIYPFYPELYDPEHGEIKEFTTLFFNAKPYIYAFYHDLGVFGVGLYSFFISTVVGIVSLASKKDVRFSLMSAFMQKAIFFLFFGNYFFGELVVFFPYAFGLLAINLMKK